MVGSAAAVKRPARLYFFSQQPHTPTSTCLCAFPDAEHSCAFPADPAHAYPTEQRKQDLQLLEAAPPDEGGGGSGRALMPYAKDADDVDPDADDDDSSSDEVR